MPKNTSFEVKIAVMNLEDDDKYVINQTNFRNNFPLNFHFCVKPKQQKHVYVRILLYSPKYV